MFKSVKLDAKITAVFVPKSRINDMVSSFSNIHNLRIKRIKIHVFPIYIPIYFAVSWFLRQRYVPNPSSNFPRTTW